MRVMIVGAGAREHALAMHLAVDPDVSEVFVAPGNGGTMSGNISNLKAYSIKAWVRAAEDKGIDLTVVGNEEPLVAGIADAFADAGLLLLGPIAAAARIEGSKSFAKKIMRKLGIPTPSYRVIYSLHEARKYLQEWEPPYVVKADGLAQGKGVVILLNKEQALASMAELLDGYYSASSAKLLLEKHMVGTELTLCVLCDGTTTEVLGTAQDFKRLRDGDDGPNTGGMGACSPSPLEQAGVIDKDELVARFVTPVLQRLASKGHEYRGFLYVGLMVTETGEVLCLEYNCRLGDPETQVLLPRWEGSIAKAFVAAAKGELEPGMLRVSDKSAVCVVMTSVGYPFLSRTKGEVSFPLTVGRDVIYHGATTKLPDGTLKIVGGRVACCTSVRGSLAEARSAAYDLINLVEMDGGHYRHDIAA